MRVLRPRPNSESRLRCVIFYNFCTEGAASVYLSVFFGVFTLHWGHGSKVTLTTSREN